MSLLDDIFDGIGSMAISGFGIRELFVRRCDGIDPLDEYDFNTHTEFVVESIQRSTNDLQESIDQINRSYEERIRQIDEEHDRIIEEIRLQTQSQLADIDRQHQEELELIEMGRVAAQRGAETAIVVCANQKDFERVNWKKEGF